MKEVLPDIYPARDLLTNDVSPLYELMKLAWAVHEMTDEHIEEVREIFRRGRTSKLTYVLDARFL